MVYWPGKYWIDQNVSPQRACEDYTKPHETCCGRVDDIIDDAMFQIEIIKSRLHANQFLHDSLQEESLSSTVSYLSDEVKLLQLDFEEEKLRNAKSVLEVEYLREEICIIKSFYNGTTCSTENTKINHEHDKNIIKNSVDSGESTSKLRNNTEAGVRLVDQIEKQILDYHCKQYNKYHSVI